MRSCLSLLSNNDEGWAKELVEAQPEAEPSKQKQGRRHLRVAAEVVVQDVPEGGASAGDEEARMPVVR
jgi:hypothetical protein